VRKYNGDESDDDDYDEEEEEKELRESHRLEETFNKESVFNRVTQLQGIDNEQDEELKQPFSNMMSPTDII
jgi:hypothetical protein